MKETVKYLLKKFAEVTYNSVMLFIIITGIYKGLAEKDFFYLIIACVLLSLSWDDLKDIIQGVKK